MRKSKKKVEPFNNAKFWKSVKKGDVVSVTNTGGYNYVGQIVSIKGRKCVLTGTSVGTIELLKEGVYEGSRIGGKEVWKEPDRYDDAG